MNTGDVMREFARRMHEVCDELGIPPGRGRQTALGQRFQVTPKAARKWLEGLGYPEMQLAVRIANEAKVHVTWLLQGSAPKFLDSARTATSAQLGEIVGSLPEAERQQAIDFIRYKVERSGQWYAAEQVARYVSLLDSLSTIRTR